MKRLLIVGAGGFGWEVLNYAYDVPPHLRDWEVGGFLDSRPNILEGFNSPLANLGDPLTFEFTANDRFIIAIGDPKIRLYYGRALQARGCQFINLKSPSFDASADLRLGVGCILASYAGISARVTIGNFVMINSRATVGHDAVIGDGCTISAHCDIAGGAVLEDGAFLGSHAVILPKARVGAYATVGAGSVVLKKVRSRTTVMGVPAKQIAGFEETTEPETITESETSPAQLPEIELKQIVNFNDEFDAPELDTNKWHWINQGNATVEQLNSRLILTAPLAQNSLRILCQTIPLKAWTVRAKIQLYSKQYGNYNIGGIGVRDSVSGQLTLLGFFWYSFAFGPFDSVRAGVGIWNYLGPTQLDTVCTTTSDFGGFDKYFQIQNDGNQLIYSYSMDGEFYMELFRHSHTDNLNHPDQIALMVDTNSLCNGPVSLVCDWIRVDA